MASYNKKEHLRANIEAIKTVFTLHREQRTATPEERMILAAYTGFGALKCILSPANTMEDIARWNKSEVELFPLVMELHRIIRDNTASESQYKSYMQSLKNSVMTAFYTPAPIVREIATSLQEAGIVPQRILDPSAGMGEFIRSFDGIAAEGHTTFGFEKDILTGQMLSALHPEDKIRIRGFEEIESKLGDYFDVVSSNIPFGDVAVFDPVFSKTDEPARKIARMSLHNYFLVKSAGLIRAESSISLLEGIFGALSISESTRALATALSKGTLKKFSGVGCLNCRMKLERKFSNALLCLSNFRKLCSCSAVGGTVFSLPFSSVPATALRFSSF